MTNSIRHRRPAFLLPPLWILSLVIWALLRALAIPSAQYAIPVLLKGLWFDIHVLLVVSAPYFFLKLILPNRIFSNRIAQVLSQALLFVAIFMLYFLSASEIVFWQEFSSRFNFIAVDYLVYTQEVIGNIRESYPMVPILSGLLILTLVTFYLFQTRYELTTLIVDKKKRIALIAILFIITPLSFVAHDLDQFEFSDAFANEASLNGIYSLFAAYRRNEIQYSRFYKTIPQSEADAILRQTGVARLPVAQFHGQFDPVPDVHEPDEMGPFKRVPKNIILITVESLSAEFLGTFGNKASLTPNLDRLSQNGYVFTHFFATGTRTVRGLEAMSLGIPPVPGQAVVRRPHNEHLVTLGEMLRKQGMKTFFFYGGYGYFDNMNDYFLSNDYEVLDRQSFDQKSITFANVWGVADEILFSNTARLLTEKTKSEDHFFAQIMTTSNHRPYTYPDGRIDIRSPGGRKGAVKYTDYAIGEFIRNAEKEPWFKDTLFVIVADHCAAVAGKTKLPIANYLIPMIFYGPDLVRPGHYDRIASQIDVAPTLIDLLQLHGDDFFFGDSLFENQNKPGRAFVSNYQELGYYKNDILTVLKPKRHVEAFQVNSTTFEMTPIDVRGDLEREAISYYQTADVSLRTGMLKYHDADIK